MNSIEARAAYLRLLMDRVRQDRHPSATHMAMIPTVAMPIMVEY